MNQQECWAAIQEGKTLIAGDMIYMNIQGRLHYKQGKQEWDVHSIYQNDFIDNDHIKIYQPWYLEITKPIWCKVGDTKIADGSIMVVDIRRIKSCKPNDEYKFVTMDNSVYKYAEPCTKEEVLQFVLEANGWLTY
jgi:hypothetical protein